MCPQQFLNLSEVLCNHQVFLPWPSHLREALPSHVDWLLALGSAVTLVTQVFTRALLLELQHNSAQSAFTDSLIDCCLCFRKSSLNPFWCNSHPLQLTGLGKAGTDTAPRGCSPHRQLRFASVLWPSGSGRDPRG